MSKCLTRETPLPQGDHAVKQPSTKQETVCATVSNASPEKAEGTEER